MKEKFFNKKVDYFWEYEYSFGEYFLKEIFKDKYRRKMSMAGSGIYNLLYIDNAIYDISFKETKSLMVADGKSAVRDVVKNDIVYLICEELGNNAIEYTVNSGKYITFKLGKYIAKLEIVKKMKEPA